MSDKVQFVILQRVDLMTANPTLVYDQALERYNGGAHEWRVHVVANSRPVDLTGCTVSCYAARSDKKTVYVKGKVSGSVASCEFDAAFYAINGDVAARMELSNSAGRVMAVARMCCTVSQTGTDTVIDPGGTIPSLDNLMALLDEMASATRAANEAAAKANAAADASTHPPYIDAANNHWVVWNVEANGYRNTGIAATGPMGPSGEDAPIPYIGANGNWFVAGADTGVKAQGPAGQNGTVTGIRIGDTVYQPDASGVVLIENVGGDSLPAGGAAGQILAKKTGDDGDAEWVDPPEGTLKSVCGKEADENGGVDLTASDVGAVTGVKVDEQIYQPDSDGVVTLPKSGAQINDTTPSANNVYSSQKTQYELNQLSQQIPDPYTLPKASSSVLGGVKVGSGLTIDVNGVLSLALADGDEVSY